MNEQRVRVGIVGMGIGRHNGRALAKNPRGSVIALCDLFEDRMQEFASELGEPVRLYTDYRSLCHDPEVDAVFVGTPNQWHVPVTLEAVSQGKHVLVTKPLADSTQAARGLVEAAEAAEVVNMMSLTLRFEDPVHYFGQLQSRGEFGDIYYVRARSVRRSGIPDWNEGFVKEGGGAFRDMGVHILDSAWWLMGMPAPVSILGVTGAVFGPRGQGYWEFRTPPEAYYRHFAADDYTGGFIRFANGAGLQVDSFWASHQPDELQLELFGTCAGARLEPPTLYRTVDGVPQNASIQLPKAPDGLARIADHFIACILDGTECQAPLRHGLIVQEMMEALLTSARTGREVALAAAG